MVTHTLPAPTRDIPANSAARTAPTLSAYRLLRGGVLAGPFYLVVGLLQALTRPGFDLTRHDLSLLANGSLGWIQTANFLVTGMLVLGAPWACGACCGVAPAGRPCRSCWASTAWA